MSAPTREQVVQWARDAGAGFACETLLADGQDADDLLSRLASIAYAAGQAAEREAMKPAIIEACKMHTREMEGYSYFGSNPGVCEDDYEDVANDAVSIRARSQP